MQDGGLKMAEVSLQKNFLFFKLVSSGIIEVPNFDSEVILNFRMAEVSLQKNFLFFKLVSSRIIEVANFDSEAVLNFRHLKCNVADSRWRKFLYQRIFFLRLVSKGLLRPLIPNLSLVFTKL